MKNNLLLPFYLIFFLSVNGFCQSLTFERTYGLSNTEINGFKLIENNDRTFLIGGTGYPWGTSDGFLCLIKTDSAGNLLWNKFYSDTATQPYLYGLEPAENNTYLLSGGTSIHYNADLFLTKVDSSGNIIWSQSYGKNSNIGFNVSLGIRVLSDGNYLVYGYTNEYGIYYDSYIIKTDTSGNTLWAKAFGTPNHNGSSDVVNTPDGNFCVLGHDSFFTTLTKFDLNGNKLWNKNFNIQGAQSQSNWSLKLCTDNGFIAAGVWMPDTNNGFHPFLLKTDSAGNVEWCKIYVGPSNASEFFHVIETDDHGFLATWEPEGVCTYCRSGLVKTDSIGNLQWAKLYDLTEYNFPWNTIQTKDGGYAQIGYLAPGSKALLIKTDSSGYTGCHDTSVVINPINTSVNVADSFYVDSGFTVNPYPLFVTSVPLSSTIPCIEILPIGAFTSSANTICLGSCIDFTNLSLNGNSNQWFFTGAIPSTSTANDPQNICYAISGNYDVMLVVSNLFTRDTIILTNYITVYPSPPPQSITQSGDTLFAIAGSSSYQWYFNTNIINGATNYFYVAPASGDYNVVATDANGCEVEAAIFNVIASVNTIRDQEILIFPNPAEEEFTIHNSRFTSETAIEISIYNVLGEKIYISAYHEPLTVNCEHFPSGLYYLEIKTSEKTFRNKFVKQ